MSKLRKIATLSLIVLMLFATYASFIKLANATSYTDTVGSGLYNVGSYNNIAFARQITASNTGYLLNLALYVNSAAGNIQLGIYSDNSNKPGTLLSYSASTLAVSNQWNTLPVTQITITSGTKYWLAWVASSVSCRFELDNFVSQYYYSGGGYSLPAGSSMSSTSSYYGVYMTMTYSTSTTPLNHFTITNTPTTTNSGVVFNSVTVTAYQTSDQSSISTGYRGSVYFTSSDGAATLPYNSTGTEYTFTSGDNGAHVFNGFILYIPGSQTITVTDPSAAISATSSTITVTSTNVVTQTLQTTLDTYVDATNHATNYYGSTSLHLQSDTLGNDFRRTYINFNWADIPLNAVITSATLNLYVDGGSPSYLLNEKDITIGRCITTWNPTTLTWDTQPTVGVSAGYQQYRTNGWYSFDVTNQLIGLNYLYGLEVQMANEYTVPALEFIYASDSVAGYGPYLNVTYSVPTGVFVTGITFLNPECYTDGSKWAFANDQYYQFQVSGTSTVGTNFTMEFAYQYVTGDWADVAYNATTGETWILYDNNTISTQPTTVSFVGYQFNITYNIFFQSSCTDTFNITGYAGYVLNGYDPFFGFAWAYNQPDLFHLYSVGGTSMDFAISNPSGGNAGRLPAGDIFDFYVTNGTSPGYPGIGTSVADSMDYRNLQEIHMEPTVTIGAMQTVNDIWMLNYRMDYATASSNAWIDGYGVAIIPGAYNFGDAARWTNYTVVLYHGGDLLWNGGTYTVGGYASVSITPGGTIDAMTTIAAYGEYNSSGYGGTWSTTFWVTMWYNQVNSSSTVGVRVSAYEYPMTDSASPWLGWLTQSWSPTNQATVATLFTNLDDQNGQLMYSSQIKLSKLDCNLTINDGVLYNQIATVTNDQTFDLTFNSAPTFSGVATPPIDTPKIPIIYGGLIGSIWAGLLGLGAMIVKALTPAWGAIVSSLNAIFTAIGWKNGFSQIINMVVSFSQGFATDVYYLLTISVPLFTFIASIFGFIFSILQGVLNFFIQLGSTVYGVLNGTYNGATGVANAMNWINQLLTAKGFVTEALPLLLVVFWFGSVDSRAKKSHEVGGPGWTSIFMSDVQSIISVFSFILDLAYRIVHIFISVIGSIIDLI